MSFNLTLGCGLNVLNPFPTTSLSQLTSGELSIERTAATIMTIFEKLWGTFLESGGSFEPFMDTYLDRWLHSCVPFCAQNLVFANQFLK
jgi:biotin---protein ligase